MNSLKNKFNFTKQKIQKISSFWNNFNLKLIQIINN